MTPERLAELTAITDPSTLSDADLQEAVSTFSDIVHTQHLNGFTSSRAIETLKRLVPEFEYRLSLASNTQQLLSPKEIQVNAAAAAMAQESGAKYAAAQAPSHSITPEQHRANAEAVLKTAKLIEQE